VSFAAKKGCNHPPHTKHTKEKIHHKGTAEHKAITGTQSFTLSRFDNREIAGENRSRAYAGKFEEEIRAGASGPSGLQIYLLECLLFITRANYLSGWEGLLRFL
jgi:hypothetical protein